MTINVALLEQTLAHIETHPQEWDQAVFRCGTGMCFAGTAATLSGGRWVTENPSEQNGEYLVAEIEDETDGDSIHVSRRARRLLGLGHGDADRLFDPDNTLDELRIIVGDLKWQATR